MAKGVDDEGPEEIRLPTRATNVEPLYNCITSLRPAPRASDDCPLGCSEDFSISDSRQVITVEKGKPAATLPPAIEDLRVISASPDTG